MAGAEGFEPPNARTKTWCLTTWPRPKDAYYYTLFLIKNYSNSFNYLNIYLLDWFKVFNFIVFFDYALFDGRACI